MKKYFSLILLFTLLISCGRNSEIKGGHEKLSKEEMAGVLLDIHLAEASAAGSLNNTNAGRDSMMVEYEKIFSKHHIKPGDFYDTYNFYIQNPELLDSVYNELVIRITTLQSKHVAPSNPSQKKIDPDSLKAEMLHRMKSHKRHR